MDTNEQASMAPSSTPMSDELKAFVNGWLVEVAFGVYDREDLPRLADKMLSEIAHHTKEAERRARIDEVRRARNLFMSGDSTETGTQVFMRHFEYLDGRLTELSAPQQSSSPDGSAK